jgi:hypothetical protein
VQSSKPIDAAKILHEAGAEFAQGFSSRLSWTHYRALLKVSDPAARAFYEIEAERENWSTPHLERQIFTALHLRLLKSRNKAGVMELARKGQTVERPSDLIKSPLILDFLGLSGRHESGREDSNLRHPGPKPGALPGCATPRCSCEPYTSTRLAADSQVLDL